MSFGSIIYSVLFQPLQLLFEILYSLANRIIDNPGLSIIVLSLAMNFLVLPLYRRADAMQEEERDMEMKLAPGVAHIKKTFKGDEKMMMLQTYYRQNGYKPTYVLRGAVSLFLEIPFFIAAYNFLSTLPIIQGVSFGPITDLGSPDGLIKVSLSFLPAFSINVLPIIMTLVNFVSSAIFTKNYPLKTKIQLYGMAVFFLIFLYDSPSGLVFYWTLNNIFSLVKTIFYKLKNPGKVLKIMASIAGIVVLIYGLFFYGHPSTKRIIFFIVFGLALEVPVILDLLKKTLLKNVKKKEAKPNTKAFVLSGILLAVLTGAIIPSAVIKSSPQEFVDVTYFVHPIWYIVASCCLAFGAFVIWFFVFYKLAKDETKIVFEKAAWCLCGICVVDYMAFGNNLGIMSSSLQYEEGMSFSKNEVLLNIGVIILIIAAFLVIFKYLRKYTSFVLGVCIAALVGMSIFNIVSINQSVDEISDVAIEENTNAVISLSKTEKNVVVIMLDRTLGEYIPYIMNEKPELEKVYDGFTYYENMISHGNKTNFGTPELFGGYEYTPIEMNSRQDETLVEKHNEALQVLPTLFSNNGMDVTLINPPYANYQNISDLSLFDNISNTVAYNTSGTFIGIETKIASVENNKRNFFCYSLMKSSPLAVQSVIYQDGLYSSNKAVSKATLDVQTTNSIHKALGLSKKHMDSYSVLLALPSITNITEGKGNFLFMVNEATHEPVLLQEPDYTPSSNVDNTKYDAENEDRFTLNGETLKMETYNQMAHYQSVMASIIKVGEWLDYLKSEGVYDNTKIIICSDHGNGQNHNENLSFKANDGTTVDVEYHYSLLMVKDFNSKGYSTSNEFMTGADVPTLALEGVIDNPINPFTGNEINSDEKTAHDQYLIQSSEWDVREQRQNTTFPVAKWIKVHTDIRDPENWSAGYAYSTVLTNSIYGK